MLQFYLNFFQKPFDCSLVHFAPHLLKTLELFNYSFNVFVSVVSGKYARHDLINMLLCRSINSCSTNHETSTQHPFVSSSRLDHQQRSKRNFDDKINLNNRRLLANNIDSD